MSNLISPIASTFSSALLSYLCLSRYLSAKAVHFIEGRSTHRLKWAFQLYLGLFDGSIKHGDRIVIDSFFVTEWIPRVPGGQALRLIRGECPQKTYLGVPEKETVIRKTISESFYVPPIGSVMLPLPSKPKGLHILGTVSGEEYCTDLGIVLSAPQSVFGQFKAKQIKDNAVEATIEGFVDLNPQGDFTAPIPSSLRNRAEILDFTSMFKRPPCVIRVDSPLQTAFRSHNSHPKVTTWMIRRLHHAYFERDKYKPENPGEKAKVFAECDFVASTLNNGSIDEILNHYKAYSELEFPGETLSLGPTAEVAGLKAHLLKNLTPWCDVIERIDPLTDFFGRERFPNTIFPMILPREENKNVESLSKCIEQMQTLERQLLVKVEKSNEK